MSVVKAEKKTFACGIYTRKSTDENLRGDFTSLDSQREYCQAFIKSREPEGWQAYPEEYNDPGFSGGNMDRPALKKLLSDVRQGKIQVVVCYKYDRLSRNTKDFLYILDILDRHGAAFVSVTQPIDTTSSIGRLMRSILMDFAQFEREMISERTRDKLAAMARRGKRIGGSPIVGYDNDREKKVILVNPAEAKIVKEMFETYLVKRSLGATAHVLNDRGYRMKQWVSREGNARGGTKFNVANLWNLLRNPLYTGKITYKGEILAGEHKAIISEKLFTDVQNVLSANGNGAVHRERTERKHPYLLGGLVRCTLCNTVMTPSHSHPRKGQRFFYYRCLSVIKSGRSACAIASVPAKTLEEFVLARLQLLSQNKQLIEAVTAQARDMSNKSLPPKREEKSSIAALLGKAEIEIKNLVGVLAREGSGSNRYALIMDRIDECTKERDSLKVRLMKVENEVTDLETQNIDAEILRRNLENFLRVLSRLNKEEQKEILKLLIKEVEFDGKGRRVRIVLRGHPAVWGELDQLEGLFDYHQRLLRD